MVCVLNFIRSSNLELRDHSDEFIIYELKTYKVLVITLLPLCKQRS